MTTDEKQLLLEDLCCRIPYGVKVAKFDEYDTAYTVNAVSTEGYVSLPATERFGYTVEDVKPFLFPLSKMTQEQIKEYYNVYWQECMDTRLNNIGVVEVFYKGTSLLNAHHFDYRGLIDKGLAIDCTNLNIY